MSKEELAEAWKYEFEAWVRIFGSDPVSLIKSKDNSPDYEMDRKHIFLLENGQYALVKECGCSCYDRSDAEICLYKTKEDALDAFKQKEEYQPVGYWD